MASLSISKSDNTLSDGIKPSRVYKSSFISQRSASPSYRFDSLAESNLNKNFLRKCIMMSSQKKRNEDLERTDGARYNWNRFQTLDDNDPRLQMVRDQDIEAFIESRKRFQKIVQSSSSDRFVSKGKNASKTGLSNPKEFMEFYKSSSKMKTANSYRKMLSTELPLPLKIEVQKDIVAILEITLNEYRTNFGAKHEHTLLANAKLIEARKTLKDYQRL